MKCTIKTLCLAVAGAAGIAACGLAQAQIAGPVVKIGFITDMSGVYSDIDGQGGVEAIKMAIADFGGSVAGKKIELVTADHQNKADIAASRAREWFDQQGVGMLIGGTNSGTNLSMAKVAAEKKKPFIAIGGGTARLTNEECTPYTVHYAYDTVALAKGTGSAVVKQGGKSWFFLTADYAFGASLESDTARVVKAEGGTVLGEVKHPLSASDFSSFLLQAQASKAQILGLANAGGDTVNLGAVATTLFTGKGVAAATQNVNIALSGCGFTGVTKITPQLIAAASLTDPDAIANGRPDIGAAVELFDADGTTHLQPNRLGTPVTVTSGATSATITLQAKFVQETATTPTPGSYQATTIISLTYS